MNDCTLAPGCYWVRSRDPAYPGVFIAELSEGQWSHFGTWSTCDQGEYEVMSPRLEPPVP